MNIIDYLFPKRKLHRIPKEITALYEREGISKHQAIIMQAGLARDPVTADDVYKKLEEIHGSKVWDAIRFEVRRQRAKTFYQRLLMLMRKLFGEDEYNGMLRERRKESRVMVDYHYEE